MNPDVKRMRIESKDAVIALRTQYGIEESLLSEEAKEAMMDQQLDGEVIANMNFSDWQEFQRLTSNILPLGLLLSIRNALSNKEKPIENDTPNIQTTRHKYPLDSWLSPVKRLFDSGEGVGTFCFLTPDIGVTAFHSVVVDEGIIREETLRVKGRKMKHLVSFPFHDLSFYKVLGHHGDFLKLASESLMLPGKFVWLLGYLDLNSQEEEEEIQDEPPLAIEGRIVKVCVGSILASYTSMSGCSGGAVLSENGYLLGMHTDWEYYEDHADYRPGGETRQLPELADLPVRGLKWDGWTPSEDLKAVETGTLARFASANVKHKHAFGSFLPASIIRGKMSEEGFGYFRKLRLPQQRRSKNC